MTTELSMNTELRFCPKKIERIFENMDFYNDSLCHVNTHVVKKY